MVNINNVKGAAEKTKALFFATKESRYLLFSVLIDLQPLIQQGDEAALNKKYRLLFNIIIPKVTQSVQSPAELLIFSEFFLVFLIYNKHLSLLLNYAEQLIQVTSNTINSYNKLKLTFKTNLKQLFSIKQHLLESFCILAKLFKYKEQLKDMFILQIYPLTTMKIYFTENRVAVLSSKDIKYFLLYIKLNRNEENMLTLSHYKNNINGRLDRNFDSLIQYTNYYSIREQALYGLNNLKMDIVKENKIQLINNDTSFFDTFKLFNKLLKNNKDKPSFDMFLEHFVDENYKEIFKNLFDLFVLKKVKEIKIRNVNKAKISTFFKLFFCIFYSTVKDEEKNKDVILEELLLVLNEDVELENNIPLLILYNQIKFNLKYDVFNGSTKLPNLGPMSSLVCYRDIVFYSLYKYDATEQSIDQQIGVVEDFIEKVYRVHKETVVHNRYMDSFELVEVLYYKNKFLDGGILEIMKRRLKLLWLLKGEKTFEVDNYLKKNTTFQESKIKQTTKDKDFFFLETQFRKLLKHTIPHSGNRSKNMLEKGVKVLDRITTIQYNDWTIPELSGIEYFVGLIILMNNAEKFKLTDKQKNLIEILLKENNDVLIKGRDIESFTNLINKYLTNE